MTENEKKTLDRIQSHKRSVSIQLSKFSTELLLRASSHDDSKLQEGEFEVFSKHVNEFGKYQFDSPEEKELRQKMMSAMELHRKRNRHHPEHFVDGIDGMNLLDLIEMLCDWRAATERSPGDSLQRSIPILKEKYNISTQLLKILENTAKDFNMY